MIKNRITSPIIPGMSGTSGTKMQYRKTEKIVMRLLPLRIINHPVNGMANKAPTDDESSTNPSVPLSILKSSCTRGNRAARLAWINPLMKNTSLTAIREGLKAISFNKRNYGINTRNQYHV